MAEAAKYHSTARSSRMSSLLHFSFDTRSDIWTFCASYVRAARLLFIGPMANAPSGAWDILWDAASWPVYQARSYRRARGENTVALFPF